MITVHLDRTNLRIIELLQREARRSVSDIARAVDRGESTVRERLAALERDGFILGYHARVDPAALGYGVRAIIRASCDPRDVPWLAERLATIPNVISAQVTTGRQPVRIELVAESLPALERIVAQRIAPLRLAGIETGVVLESLVKRRPAPIPYPSPTSSTENGARSGDPESPAAAPVEPPRPLLQK